MKNIKRFSLALALVLCLSAIFAFAIGAESEYPKLVDQADILTDAEEEKLLTRLDRLSEEYRLDIAIVTEEINGTANTALYARDLYEALGYGQGDDLSGILLYIYFDVFGGGYEIVTSGGARDIFDNSLDSLSASFEEEMSEENYYDGLSAFANKCEYLIKYDKVLPPFWIIISLIVGAVVAAIVISSMTSKHKGVKMQRSANNYILRDTFRLDRSRDVYLFSHVTRVVKPQNNSGSSGGGRSSSGRSYGGKSGRF